MPSIEVYGGQGVYELLDKLGSGQSADTFRARLVRFQTAAVPLQHHLQVGQIAVAKIARARNLHDAIRQTQLFFVEAESLKLLADLSCVAKFLDFGLWQDPDGRHRIFIIQEFIPGTVLLDYLPAHYETPFSGIQSATDFFAFARRLVCVVRDVHRNMVVHGDIWPANIIVHELGHPVLIDFGQAFLREISDDPAGLPGRNSAYIAPEGVRSVPGDIYSTGGVLYYLATGQHPPSPPPGGPAPDIDTVKSGISAVIQAVNPVLYRENCGIVDVIARCLRHNVHDRIPHAEGLLQDLDTFAGAPSARGLHDDFRDMSSAVGHLLQRGTPLFPWLASLRIRSLYSDLEEMRKGIYDLVGDHEQIVSTMTQYLSLLREGNAYLTVTLPKFWWTRNAGVDGRFLSMNVLAAQRGATIKRLFLLTPDDGKVVGQDSLQHILDSQRRTAALMSAIPTSGTYEISFIEMSDDRRLNLLAKGRHFGLVVTKEEQVAMRPLYGPDGTIVAVQFRTNPEICENSQKAFDELWREATPLQ